MKSLSLDNETFSKASLEDCGLYKYSADPSFQILMTAYKIDDKPTKLWSLATGDQYPDWFLPALQNPNIIKYAFNAQFEIRNYEIHFGVILDPAQWRCTMILSARLGLPMNLAGVGAALNLKDQKDKEGKALITYFCMPCKPIPSNDFRIRNLPEHAPAKWKKFCEYCIRDVDVEYATKEKLSVFPFDEREQRLWVLDQKINKRGFLLDRNLVKNSIKLYNEHKKNLHKEAARLTGCDNPNSLPQLKAWLGDPTMKLTKDNLPALIKDADDETIRRVLEIRQETGKSSVDKYLAMSNSMLKNDRSYGVIQHYGAGTGRSAGRIWQPHNLPRNEEKFDLDYARRLVLEGNLDMLELWFGSVIHPLSQLCRTAIIPSPGKIIIASDFSQIESRILATLAGERWKIEAFERGEDIYITLASTMFGIPRDRLRKDGDERQQGKIGELSCGYQGAEGAIFRMWPKHLPPPTDERAKEIVGRWRNACPNTVDFWYAVNAAAITAVRDKRPSAVAGCLFYMSHGILFCELPNGRALAYPRAHMGQNKWGQPCVIAYGINAQFQWAEISLYGGLLTENIVQAIGRDILFDKMEEIDRRGFYLFGHVHDETISEGIPAHIPKIDAIMNRPITWIKGLPLAAVTKGLKYYKKA